MSTKQWLLVTVPILIIILGLLVLLFFPSHRAQAPSGNTDGSTQEPVDNGIGEAPNNNVAFLRDLIEVTAPLKNATITSPLTITGEARGTWYFEASAPIELRDANGKSIAQDHVTAQGNWMTEEFVPFKATLTFPAQPKGSTGTLILKNDNPSGDPARDKKLEIPVTF